VGAGEQERTGDAGAHPSRTARYQHDGVVEPKVQCHEGTFSRISRHLCPGRAPCSYQASARFVTRRGTHAHHHEASRVGRRRRHGRRSPGQCPHRRDDGRHRRLGLPAKADGTGTGDPAIRGRGPDRRVLRRPRRRLACFDGEDPETRLRFRHARLHSLRPLVQPGSRGRRNRGDGVRRRHSRYGAFRCGTTASVPTHPRGARFRRHLLKPGAPDRARHTTTGRNYWRFRH
jgi:hypothetical protein